MALRVLGLGVFNVPARLARLIMCPFPVQGAWTVYVFDKVNRHITVLDPVSTDKGADHYEAKHRGNILHLQEGFAALGPELGSGWDIMQDQWATAFNTQMHPPCIE